MPRLTFDADETFDGVLKQLAKAKGVTKAEIIRRAVSAYDFFSSETADGDKEVMITDKKSQERKQVLLP